MNRFADRDIDPSLVNPMSPDHHHQRTSSALRSSDAIGMIGRMVLVAMTSASRSTT
jgi:hypothetical protein